VALVVYGLGTVFGSILAGHVQRRRIERALPLPALVLTAVLLTQPVLMHHSWTAMVSLFVLGGSAFVMAPLLQTLLMSEVGPSLAGLAAAGNISVAGLAAALGAGVGGVVIASGLGLEWLGPVASTATRSGVATAMAIRSRSDGRTPSTAMANELCGPSCRSMAPRRRTQGRTPARAKLLDAASRLALMQADLAAPQRIHSEAEASAQLT
jgi:MFS transporter, DHA1 family, inner membrane transport protein